MQLEIDCYEWVLRKIDLNKIPFDRLERIIKTTIKDLERRKDKAMIRTDTEVVVAEEHGRPDFASMIDRIFEIKREMGISACYVDAANPEVQQSLKKEVFDESYSEAYISEKIAYCRKNNLDLNTYMVCIPTAFSHNQGAALLQHAKSLVEDPDNLVLIDKRFDKLLIALRTATAEEYRLQKEQTSYNDILDAFRLSLQYYRRSK